MGNTSWRFCLTLGGLAAGASLAACSGGGSQSLPASTPALASADAIFGAAHTHRTAFVSVARVNAPHGNQTIIADAASATVTVWGRNGQLNAILFDGIAANPKGLATDAAETLYVANESLSNVIVYPKPYTSIGLTLNDAGESTLGVAVSKAGLVGVTNYLTTALQPGSVTLYAKGSGSACATVADPKWVTFVADAFDASGNLFIDGQNSIGTTLVGEISGGCKATSIATLSVGNVITSPGSVVVSHGSILIGDPLKQAIYTYARPSGGSLGSPTITTTLVGATYPVAFAVVGAGQALWTADLNASAAFAGEYTYPGGALVKKIDDHLLPVGVAVNPAARP